MVCGFCRRVNLDVRHLYGRATDGRHPAESVTRGTGMVQRGKALERGLQTGHHLQIGAKAACGNDHRLCRELIRAAVGILHLHARHATIDSREQV